MSLKTFGRNGLHVETLGDRAGFSGLPDRYESIENTTEGREVHIEALDKRRCLATVRRALGVQDAEDIRPIWSLS